MPCLFFFFSFFFFLFFFLAVKHRETGISICESQDQLATMKLSSTILACAAPVTGAALSDKVRGPSRHALSPRPRLVPSPYSPAVPFPVPGPRSRPARACFVETHGDAVTDDSPYILHALHTCNDGGRVVFTRATTYVIGTAMDWTFLRHVDIGASYGPPPVGAWFLRRADGWC